MGYSNCKRHRNSLLLAAKKDIEDQRQMLMTESTDHEISALNPDSKAIRHHSHNFLATPLLLSSVPLVHVLVLGRILLSLIHI